jgi:hypothetical protein
LGNDGAGVYTRDREREQSTGAAVFGHVGRLILNLLVEGARP